MVFRISACHGRDLTGTGMRYRNGCPGRNELQLTTKSEYSQRLGQRSVGEASADPTGIADVLPTGRAELTTICGFLSISIEIVINQVEQDLVRPNTSP